MGREWRDQAAACALKGVRWSVNDAIKLSPVRCGGSDGA